MGKTCVPAPIAELDNDYFESAHEDDFVITTSGSEGSLLNSLSSDSDELFPCTDDLFMGLDAQFEREKSFQSNMSYNGLYHCSCSVYDDFFNKSFCPSDDQLKSMVLPSSKPAILSAAYCAYDSPSESRVWP